MGFSLVLEQFVDAKKHRDPVRMQKALQLLKERAHHLHDACVGNGQFHVLYAGSNPTPVSVFGLSTSTPLRWVSVPLSLSDKVHTLVQGDASIILGHAASGCAVVALSGGHGSVDILSLDRSSPKVSLLHLCRLARPLGYSVGRVSMCGPRVLLSDASGTHVTSVNVRTGSAMGCGIRGRAHMPCSVGTVCIADHNLHVAVRDGTSVCVAHTVYLCCVRDDALMWVVRGAQRTTLSTTPLSPLLSTPQLPAATESHAVIHPTPHRWVHREKGKSPYTLLCHTSSGCIGVSIGVDLSLVGLGVYDPSRGWEQLVEVPTGVAVLPHVSGVPLYLDHCVYASVLGRLVRVDLGARSASAICLSLSAQPRVAADMSSLILQTPSGIRRYPLNRDMRVGALTVERVSEGSVAGVLVGDAVVKGVAGAESVYYRVDRGVWTPMDVVTSSKTRHSRVQVTSLRDLVTLLESGVAESLDVSGTEETCLHLDTALSNRCLTDCTFMHCSIKSATRASFTGCSFEGCTMVNAGLSQMSLSASSLTECDLSGSDLSKATLTDVRCKGGRLQGCSFKGTSLASVDFGGIALSGCDFTLSTFTSVSVDGCDMSEVTLNGSDLSGCRGLTVDTLHSAVSIRGAILSGRDLSGWNLSGLDLTGVVMTGTNLTACDLSGTTGMTATQLHAAASLTKVSLSGMQMGGWDLSGLCLSGADLSGCGIVGANLRDTDLTGVSLCGATGFSAKQMRDAKSVSGVMGLEKCNLTGADLSAIDLSGLNLTGANLSDTALKGTNITGTTLTGAILVNAPLCETIGLSWKHIRNAGCLKGANLAKRCLTAQDMSGLDLSGVCLDGCNLKGTNFTGSILKDVSLVGVSHLNPKQLRSAKDVIGLNMSGLNMAYWDMYGLDLSRSNLSNCDLSGATLTGTVLTGADLSHSTLRLIIGLTERQLRDATSL
ncbi:hypothetical protein KIPB_002810 [Kipferlia bialata]|uniref:Uncharacterized protein n=1 Tax=Kipferlia bialata TaxID=797122 RepID=A0A391NJL3_9EUKA|nr:hypothetical protein KIPB_002810 [Kipferlia bialata]|eukprot:g2810.t1